MEANMGILRRRLNKAMVECRSQASFTARRLVGQIRTMERRARNGPKSAAGHQARAAHGSASGGPPSRRHFSYTFAPASAAYDHDNNNNMSTERGAKPGWQSRETDQDFAREQQQQVEEFSSDEDENQSNAIDRNTRDTERQNFDATNDKLHNDNMRNHFKVNNSVQQQPTSSSSSYRNHKIFRVKMPTNLRSGVRHFIRGSAINGSRRRRSGRKSLAVASALSRGSRQVRFQPVAQSIDISTVEYDDNDDSTENRLHDGQDNDEEDDDDFGWGSDFDESQSQESSLTSPGVEHGGSSYLLEIGKSSVDQRAIEDVIQDQGISGQFKRLDQSLEHDQSPRVAPPPPPPAPQHRSNVSTVPAINHKLRIELERRQQSEQMLQQPVDERRAGFSASASCDRDTTKETSANLEAADVEVDAEDDEEAELRSLEARQGFRRIRDKLKIILDQRLANYEHACGATLSQANEAEPVANHNSAIRSGGDKVGGGIAKDSADERCRVVSPTHQQQAVAAAASHNVHASANNGGEFDCQSHCSDESSGMESNHSGSQDSGHSTQHSGYSCLATANHHHNHQHPSIESQESSTTSPVACVSPAVSAISSVNSKSPVAGAESPVAQEQDPEQQPQQDDGDTAERRSRFLQNRRIINSKLESMFKSRSGSSVVESAAPQVAQPSGRHSVVAHVSRSNTMCASQVDPDVRMRLLEQQRQMSLKLKQKPRRKLTSASKRTDDQHQVAAPPPPPSSIGTASSVSGASSISGNGSCTETENEGSYPTSGHFQRVGSRRRGRESLTKQLSMICLRQAGQVVQQRGHQLQNHHAHHHHHHQPAALPAMSSMACSQQQLASSASTAATCSQQLVVQPTSSGAICTSTSQVATVPRAAMSLRQLVKDVIDDCEKPSKLSTLTRSILNRSESLESELSSEHTNMATGGQSPAKGAVDSDECHSPASSSLSSLSPQADQQQPNSTQVTSNTTREVNGRPAALVHAVSCHPIGCIQPVSHSTPTRTHNSNYNNYSSPADQSLSSLGTVDGLEYVNRTYSSGELTVAAAELAQQQQLQQQQAASHCRLPNKSSIGSYLKSLREFSRMKLPKVRLTGGGGQPMGAAIISDTGSDRAGGATGSSSRLVDGYPVIANKPSAADAFDSFSLADARCYNQPAGEGGAANYRHHYRQHNQHQQQEQLQQLHYGKSGNSTSNNNDFHYTSQHHLAASSSRARLPGGSNTIAGVWRRRNKRASIIDSQGGLAASSLTPRCLASQWSGDES